MTVPERRSGHVVSAGHDVAGRPILVIGGGAAGIATSAVFRRAGLRTVVLDESERVGNSWRRRYDRLRLNSSRLTSRVARTPFRRGTSLFPTRQEFAAYLEDCAAHHRVDVRLGTRALHVDRHDGRWAVQTSSGLLEADDVIVATGYAREPFVPAWTGRERYGGELLHSDTYRAPRGFRGRDVLVVGPGSSGMEIAYDLAESGAGRVRLAVRTPPNIVLRSVLGLPGDPVALALLHAPPRVADAQLSLMRRLVIGDLADEGLPAPDEGPFARVRREGVAPAVVDGEVVEAIRAGHIEVVPGVERLDGSGAALADGRRVEPEAIIAATGFRCGLEPLVGHLGVLDDRGVPRVVGGGEAAPGLRFVGFTALPGMLIRAGAEAARAARGILAGRA
jgi:cation diffusion facilitator CzcD-associated flavoprotein CzcO